MSSNFNINDPNPFRNGQTELDENNLNELVNHARNASNISAGILSVARGGTGTTSAANARASLGITPANIGAAPINNPNLQGMATAPTPMLNDNSNRIATTHFVRNYVDSYNNNFERVVWTGEPVEDGGASNLRTIIFELPPDYITRLRKIEFSYSMGAGGIVTIDGRAVSGSISIDRIPFIKEITPPSIVKTLTAHGNGTVSGTSFLIAGTVVLTIDISDPTLLTFIGEFSSVPQIQFFGGGQQIEELVLYLEKEGI